MSLLYVTCVTILCMVALATADTPHPLSDEFIDLINEKQNSWKAGRNFPKNTPMAHITKLMGLLPGDDNFLKLPVKVHDDSVIANLPENFDPREKWPNCPSLNDIRDQGSCGSCWAFGAVEAMTDRYCIYTNGSKQFYFSADDLVSCNTDADGCHGGQMVASFQYWKDHGLVSGGEYNSSQGCRPYEVPPCEHHVPGNRPPCTDDAPTPKCSRSCVKSYDVEYEKDKKFAKAIYSVHGSEDQMKAELYQHGPVETGLDVYADFLAYKSGVYRHVNGEALGGHAVKLMGWGEENGVKYWLVANSWNSDWGDKGYFKIVRGENHCGIEDSVVAGEPLIQ